MSDMFSSDTLIDDLTKGTDAVVDQQTAAPKGKTSKPKAKAGEAKPLTKAELKAKALADDIAAAQAETQRLADVAKAEKVAKAAADKAEKEAAAAIAAKAKADQEAFAAKVAAEAEANRLAKIETGMATAKAAFSAIARKDADLLTQYLLLGEFTSNIAPLFKSTKLFGQYVADQIPESASLDPALRSNCKWLYEALNVADHEASDILPVLGVNEIASYKRSGNPTVIRKAYRDAKDAQALKAKAEEMGCTEEEAEEAEAKSAKDDKAAKMAAAMALVIEYADQLNFIPTKAVIAGDVADLLTTLFTDGLKTGFEKLVADVEANRPMVAKAKAKLAKAGTTATPPADEPEGDDPSE